MLQEQKIRTKLPEFLVHHFENQIVYEQHYISLQYKQPETKHQKHMLQVLDEHVPWTHREVVEEHQIGHIFHP